MTQPPADGRQPWTPDYSDAGFAQTQPYDSPPGGQPWQQQQGWGPPAYGHETTAQAWQQQPAWRPDGHHHGEASAALQAGVRTGIRASCQLLCPVLLVAGLSIPENDTQGWTAWPAWAIFATVAAFVQLAPLVRSITSMSAATAWTLGAVATAALGGYWVVIVLPGVSSNTGFCQTLAVACAVIGCWLSPDRRV